MEYYIGKRTRASFAKEGAYGTASTASKYGWPGVVESVTPSSKSDIIQINAMDDSDTRDVSDYFETLRRYSFSTEFLLQYARPLYFAWGSDVLASGANEVHTITGANTLPSFTFQAGYDGSTDHVMTYAGCMINKLDISCTKGEFVKCTAEVVAQTSTSGTAFKSYYTGASDILAHPALAKYPSIGEVSDNPILPYHYSHSTINIDGTDYCEVDTVKLSINNNLLSEPTLCATSGKQKRIAEPIPQLREYDASATIRMSSAVFNTMWETGTYITDPTITFARTAGSDQIVFTLNDAIVESAISPFKISEGMVLVEVPFKVVSIGVVETNDIDEQYDATEA